MASLIVDIHNHIISRDLETYPQVPLGGVQSDWSKERPATWEELAAEMDLAGIGKAAVVQSSTTYGHDNSYLADCVDRNSERVVGVCSIGLTDADVVPQIKHWISERGLSGVRIFVTGSTMKGAFQLDHEQAKPAWAYLAEHGIPVSMNVDQDSFGQLRAVLQQFSDLRLVLDHVGRTNFDSGPPYLADHPLLQFAELPGVHLKATSTTFRSAAKSAGGAREALGEVVSYFGSERVAWGSNWPAAAGGLSELKDLLLDAITGLPEADVENICAKTALALYPRLAG